MSANNQLIIKHDPDEVFAWRVDVKDVDTGHGYMVADSLASLEDAIRAADRYMEENEVEYGYRIILPK